MQAIASTHIWWVRKNFRQFIRVPAAMLPCAAVNDYFSLRRRQIDEYLQGLARRTGAPKPLAAPLAQSLASPGKRVRGILLMAAGESAGAKGEKLIEAAAAV